MSETLRCPRCRVAMIPQIEPLDLSWAGDGPNADDIEFQGIFAEVHRCPSCRGIATRPVKFSLPSRSLAAASAAILVPA
ncbi:MAG: zf-TFIIB domain-containing protein [Acidobacteriota bacterium]|nr:zf-TFIIB domain-containing protein [Acidobacteriota bacterium]